MKPKRTTNARTVRLALQRVKTRRYRERNRDALNAARRGQQPEWWVANRERVLSRRRTPEARDRARTYETKRRHSGEIAARLMLSKARQRAKKFGLECTITLTDICVPETCPLLGMPLFVNVQQGAGPNSPSLDRKDSTKGYVPGNVWVISYRANTIKSDATADELMTIATALRQMGV